MLARERPFEGDARPYDGSDVKARHPPRSPEGPILDRAQIVCRLFDAFGNVREILEHCAPKRRVEFVGGGTTNRVDAEIQVSQSHGQRISDLVRDDAGLAGELPQSLSGREPATRTVLGGRNGTEGQSGKLEHQPLAAAAFQTGRRRGRRARANRRDDPQTPCEESAPHPAGLLHDRRAPAPERGLEIELDIPGVRIRNATEDRHGGRGRGDLPQRHSATA